VAFFGINTTASVGGAAAFFVVNTTEADFGLSALVVGACLCEDADFGLTVILPSTATTTALEGVESFSLPRSSAVTSSSRALSQTCGSLSF
jgi:hypothetical protein